MSNLLYHYDPKTGLLLSSSRRRIDPKATIDSANPVYFDLPHTTTIPPHNSDKPGMVQFFDTASNSWRFTEDNRGLQVINTETKEIITWKNIGKIPSYYTTDIPDQNVIEYVTWSGTQWVVTEEKRQEILDKIWNHVKTVRDKKCIEDIAYNEHYFHVDPTSFNDITLAAQEALLTQDFTTTKRWVAADNDSVQLNGLDFINIMRLYGQRRQTLVYKSNEDWNYYESCDTEMLLHILDQFTNKGE